MNTIWRIAYDTFLSQTDISVQSLHTVLSQIACPSIDFADIFLQTIHEESWLLEDNIVKVGSFNIETGVGVRAVSGAKTGLAYSNGINVADLKQAALMAKSIAVSAGSQAAHPLERNNIEQQLYPHDNPLDSLSENEKVALLQRMDKEAHGIDSRVRHVSVSLSGVYEVVLIANSQGTLTADVRPLVSLHVGVIVESNGRREHGNYGGGVRGGYEFALQNNTASHYVQEAVRIALLNLDARPAPAGVMPVVLGHGWPGVLLHEAVGHGLEGDFNRRGSSVYSGKIGEQVASPLCTIADDGSLPGLRGSLNVDDEGVQTRRNVLIEKGILKGYLLDKLNAGLLGMETTGNGRRESFASMPVPRMTNTFMLPGKSSPEEIIASVDNGIYAVNFSGGQVDITSGKFVFTTSEAYLIEHGKVTAPIKNATLIGDGPDVLQKIVMVGDDLAFDSGVGSCGKDGQGVPVGVGQPTLKVSELTVGGTGGV